MNEPQTLTAADVVGIPTGNPDTRTPDPYMDGVADYLKGGSLTAAEIVRRVFQNPEPDQGAVDALERQLGNDPRFVAMADGWDLVGLPPAEGKSIADCMAANEATADKLADPVQESPAAAPSDTVQAVEGTGSETIASETPAPTVVVVDPRDEQIRNLKRKLRETRDELAAHQEREEREKELTGDITKASKDVEAAKEVLAGKKAALATAHEQLFLFASGDTQTSHPALKGEDDEEGDEDEQGRPAPVVHIPIPPAVAATVQAAQDAVVASLTPKPFEHAVAADQVVPDHGLDLLSLRGRLRRDLPAAEKPHQIGPAVFECRGCQWLLRDVNDDETRWFAQRVLSKDEWQQLHEKEFGMCVEGFDQNEEAKHHRTQGGEDNGRVVRVGKKKGVMGPEREGLVLTLPAAVGEAAPFDAKSAAANDTVEEHKEEGEHVSGNTVGGCVHSNPND